MSAKSPAKSLARGVATLLALVLVVAACSSSVTDGATCEANGDCVSNKCVGGTCQGRDCNCEGATCRSRAGCLEGWLCTRGGSVTEQNPLPRCRKECAGPGQCVASEHCDDGVCSDGPEPFSMVWESFPRAVSCSPNFPCPYKVRVTAPVTVVTYSWSFGGGAPIETKVPETSFEYPSYGTYPVVVQARATTGAVAELKETEILCLVQSEACDPVGVKCCFGACPISGVCP